MTLHTVRYQGMTGSTSRLAAVLVNVLPVHMVDVMAGPNGSSQSMTSSDIACDIRLSTNV